METEIFFESTTLVPNYTASHPIRCYIEHMINVMTSDVFPSAERRLLVLSRDLAKWVRLGETNLVDNDEEAQT
jgi:hypothetical protein